MTRRGPSAFPWPARFWMKVEGGRDDDCWMWTGSFTGRDRNYGHTHVPDGRFRLAHVVAFELSGGVIPRGFVLDHLCRQPSCCNPAHLEPVTNRENVIVRGQGLFANRARSSTCIRGHELTGSNLIRRGRTARPRRECRACRELRRDRKAAAA